MAPACVDSMSSSKTKQPHPHPLESTPYVPRRLQQLYPKLSTTKTGIPQHLYRHNTLKSPPPPPPKRRTPMTKALTRQNIHAMHTNPLTCTQTHKTHSAVFLSRRQAGWTAKLSDLCPNQIVKAQDEQQRAPKAVNNPPPPQLINKSIDKHVTCHDYGLKDRCICYQTQKKNRYALMHAYMNAFMPYLV